MKISVIILAYCVLALFTIDAKAQDNVIFEEVHSLKQGVRGDDILSTKDGIFISGWHPGNIMRPYITKYTSNFSEQVWEKEPVTSKGAILMSMAANGDQDIIYISGAAQKSDSSDFNPLVLSIDSSGNELSRWQGEFSGSHTLWDIEYHSATNSVYVVGETGYHLDESHIFVARLNSELELDWQRVFRISERRGAAYALAIQNDTLVIAGGTTSGNAENSNRFPVLLRVGLAGNEIDLKIMPEQPNSIYHWLRANDQTLIAGGYGTINEEPANQATVFFINKKFEVIKSRIFGGDKDDRTIHSDICGERVYFGGFSQSYSDTGWRGYVASVDFSGETGSVIILEHGSDTIAVRNFECRIQDSVPLYVGYIQNSQGTVSLVAGTLIN